MSNAAGTDGSGGPAAVERGRAAVRGSFRWHHGHADVWRVFRDGEALAAVVRGLAAPYTGRRVTAVAGVEARGFLLGAAVAVELGVGFVAVRKAGALFPGATAAETAEGPNYRGLTPELLVQTDRLGAADRLLLVDDWIETGGQAHAVARLVRRCGAVLAGISVMVDQLAGSARPGLPPVTALVTADELRPARCAPES